MILLKFLTLTALFTLFSAFCNYSVQKHSYQWIPRAFVSCLTKSSVSLLKDKVRLFFCSFFLYKRQDNFFEFFHLGILGKTKRSSERFTSVDEILKTNNSNETYPVTFHLVLFVSR